MGKDPYRYFRIEARELLGELGKGLLDLERAADAALVARLLRYAHTLKGAARIVRHKELADLAHTLEDLLTPLRDHPAPQRHDAALALVDQMAARLDALPAPEPSPLPAPGPPQPRPAPQPAAAPAPAPTRTVAPAVAAPAIPVVQSTEIDDVLGSLANAHALVGRLRAATDPAAIARQLHQLDRDLREIRRDVEHLRLSRAGSMFIALERTARDAAVATGKRVIFTGDGGDVRFDSAVLAAVHGAMVQLVRNAVAHGIEPPDERARAGKPPDGRVAVQVQSLGRRIALTCTDDGRGLDLAAIRAAAERRGLVPAPELDAVAAFELLLRGGISTAAEVTELAGRGIGLDLVRQTVLELGGDVGVRVPAGGGTAIAIHVPVSAAAGSLLLTEVGGRTIAVGNRVVRRVVRLRPGDLVHGPDGTSLVTADLTVPFASLGALIGGEPAPARIAVIVAAADGSTAALGVDRVIGVEEAVMRSLPPGVPVDPLVWGVAIDAGGRPYPVLDSRAVVAAARGARPVVEPAPAPPRPILVVDDSLTTRMLEQSILESAGFDVDVAASAEEALGKLADRVYALVLTDVEMPGMDGFGLVAELRARPALAELPAILVTSRDAQVDRERGASVGAQGYIIKSQFDQVELLAMIRRLVGA